MNAGIYLLILNFILSIPALNLIADHNSMLNYYSNLCIHGVRIIMSIIAISFLTLNDKDTIHKILSKDNFINEYKNTNKEQITIIIYFSIIGVHINSYTILSWVALCILEKLIMRKVT
jgi:hypothetical protein